VAKLPRFLLRHRITIEPYRGTWGVYGAATADVRCAVGMRLSTAMGTAGTQRITTLTVVAPVDVDCPEGSRITLPDGRQGYAAAVARHDTGTGAAIDHTEIAVEVGGTYGPPHGESVVLLHRTVTGQDRYGNDRYTVTPTTIGGCAVRALSSQETTGQGNDRITDSIEVVFPPGTDVGADDRMQVRGLVYEVDGTPDEQLNPMTGVAPGVRVIGRRIAG
jgi:hypothetical protein